MEESKLTREQILEADAYFNLASLLGRAIQAAAFQLRHPDYDPTVTFKDIPDAAPQLLDSDAAPQEIAAQEADDSISAAAPIKSNEASLDEQIDQLIDLYIPEIYKQLRPSALFELFKFAASRFDLEDEQLAKDILPPEVKRDAAVAWVIAKRVFAVRHPDETVIVLDLPDTILDKDATPYPFRPVDDTDLEMVDHTCSRILENRKKDQAPSAISEEELKEIIELKPSDNIVLMTSKVARSMFAIAGAKVPAEVDVSSKNSTDSVIVRATIGNWGGRESVSLTRTDYDVMEAVGQIVQENGKGIIITPNQIYRKISFADSSYNVSDQILDEIIKSMDKLLFTPATLDFTEQIEKHTKLKAKNKAIENGEEKGRIKGNIISGLHLQKNYATHRGKTVEHSFLIYDMPMFYYYSQAIKHIATVPGYLLSGSPPRNKTAPKKAQKKESAQQRLTLREIGLRRYLLERIEYFKKLKKQAAEESRRHGEKRTEYSYHLSFEGIAKDLNYEVDTEKRKRMLRGQTYDFMAEQVEMKNIKRCEYYCQGRALVGVTIFL